MTFFLVVFILVMQFLFRYIDDLIGKGLETYILIKFLMYTSATMVPLALPLAILMAALMTFGNLGENYELTALKSSGISLQRIMMPLIILTLIVCIGAFFFSNYILPVSNLKMRSLLYDIQQQRPEFQIVEGIFYNGIDGFSIRIDKKDHKTNMLYNIKIYDHTHLDGNTTVTIADSGKMRFSADERYLLITLYSGQTYDELHSERRNKRDFTFPQRRDKFQEQTLMLEMSGFELKRTDESLFRSHYAMMSLAQLQHFEDSLTAEIGNIHNSLQKTLITSAYYNFRESVPKKHRDTIRPSEIYKLNVDSFYTNLSSHYQKMTLDQALNQARSALNYISSSFMNVDSKINRLRKYQIEIQRKFTLSFACLIFFFIGAPLGAIIRKGGLGMPAVISVLFFLVYYIISLSGEKFARESMVSPIQGMWISAFILLPIGIFLTYKAATDSAIMNTETYNNFFRKYYRRIRFLLLKLRLRK